MSTTTTPNLGLIKPTPGTREPIKIADLNANADKIDAKLVQNTAPGNNATNADRAVYLSGIFTGASETIGLGIDYVLTPTAGVGTGQGGDAALQKINGTLKMAAGPGFNGILAALRVETTFVGIAGGHQLGMYLLNLRSFVVPSLGTIDVAATLTVDSPSGPAGHLYSIMNSGTVQMRGASSLSFEQIGAADPGGAVDSLIGGATGAGVYVPGSATGDLCIRTSTGKHILISGDQGGQCHIAIGTRMAFGTSSFDLNRWLHINPGFTGDVDCNIVGITGTAVVPVNGSASGLNIGTGITEAASGTHPILAGITVAIGITNGAAATTLAAGINVATFVAAAGTVSAAGIRVDVPTGATNNWAITVSSGKIAVPGGATPVLAARSSVTDGAGAGAGTLTNAPSAGNPTKWIPFDDGGTTRYFPAW